MILDKKMQDVLDKRIKEMLNNSSILEKFNNFENEQDAQKWITTQAIATLIGLYR